MSSSVHLRKRLPNTQISIPGCVLATLSSGSGKQLSSALGPTGPLSEPDPPHVPPGAQPQGLIRPSSSVSNLGTVLTLASWPCCDHTVCRSPAASCPSRDERTPPPRPRAPLTAPEPTPHCPRAAVELSTRQNLLGSQFQGLYSEPLLEKSWPMRVSPQDTGQQGRAAEDVRAQGRGEEDI